MPDLDLAAIESELDGGYLRPRTARALLAHIEAQERRIAELKRERDSARSDADGLLIDGHRNFVEQQSEIDRLRELLREALVYVPTFDPRPEETALRERIDAALSERPKPASLDAIVSDKTPLADPPRELPTRPSSVKPVRLSDRPQPPEEP